MARLYSTLDIKYSSCLINKRYIFNSKLFNIYRGEILFLRIINFIGAKHMFGLFKSARFSDPQLGELVRSRGNWRGSISLGGSSASLIISGSRNEPSAEAIHTARSLIHQFPTWKSVIENTLFEHYTPYAEALEAGELAPPSEPFPRLGAADQVWPHITLIFVSVSPLDGKLTTELGYVTAWDEEHTLGARFQEGKIVELCASVVPD
jgi:hypothetical protein